MIQNEKLSTGLPGFDDVIKQVLPGDNIVWQVDSVEDFLPLVKPYCDNATESGWELVYFRFASHAPFVTAAEGANVIELDPQLGFEYFTTEVHNVINKFGKGHYYLFDCLSELASSWYNDRMLGNFFMQVCPYLYYAQTVTAFALLRNYHSFHATRPILDTAQVISNVYRYNEKTYVQPIKVDARYSPTMNMIHLWDGDDFTPVCDSGTITEILSSVGGIELDAASEKPGFWARTFQKADKISEDCKQGICKKAQADEMFNQLVRMIVSKDERMLKLAMKYLDIDDLRHIRKRMVGTGLIGGKSVGMLFARAILEKTDESLKKLLEPHDSFFVGSDVFYTYLVKNKIWWLRQKQRNNINFLDGASEGRLRIMQGEFPDYIQKQFSDVLDYYGQSPIIVRSSSILEDNYGNAFAGKYESFFCANQGTRQQRLDEFVTAIKKIYASSMSEDALMYRSKWGLLEKDEPMGLLVQRVSGAPYGDRFFPQAAGVGLSYNPYVWTEDIDPKAGMLRLVFGMGTRAVDRNDDDYARIVSLSDPSKRPESNIDEARKYTQQKVDAVDLAAGEFVTKSFIDIAKVSDANLRLDMFASRDREMEKRAARLGKKDIFSWAITFEKLLAKTDFPQQMRKILKIIQKVYNSPVDVEFALNFVNESEYKINILQCRPLELRGGGDIGERSLAVKEKDRIIYVSGPVIGQSRQLEIDRVIYICPDEYHKLKIGDRYELARIIGRLTHATGDRNENTTMLIGPGRWGTSTPSLGVPVSYPEINTISVLAEIAIFNKEISAEVSLGTHFFSDLIENDTLYLGILSNRDTNVCRNNFFENSANELAEILPSFESWSKLIRVIDSANIKSGRKLCLHANAIDQNFMLYLK